jgi:lysosomal acid lipase/cholesteryl ester hydrolase
MAKFDITAQTDYALKVTGQRSLSYIGHSQGTTSAFANFLQTSEFNLHLQGKINTFVALAPVFHLSSTMSVLLQAVAHLDLDVLGKLLGIREFLPSSKILKLLLPGLCKATPQLCDWVIYLFCGFDRNDFDAERMPVYMAHFPSGISMMELSHYAQSIRKNQVTYYDYGLLGNLKHYNNAQPPIYNLSLSQAPPTYLFYGANDDLADPTDVTELIKQFPSSLQAGVTFNNDYGHLDYVWGKDAYIDVYGPILNILKKVNSSLVDEIPLVFTL